jgi:hypothetical protein
MPVTVKVSKHEANEAKPRKFESHRKLLQEVYTGPSLDKYEIFQSSFINGDEANTRNVAEDARMNVSTTQLWPAPRGLISTALVAYNRHHHLVLRPDDVWLSILVQFNLFVNANSELLRDQFVAHSGKEAVEVIRRGNRDTADYGEMSIEMTRIMDKKIVDPELRQWIMPQFSTTTTNDEIVCSIVMMATLKSYFNYVMTTMCGLPSVTLLGEKADWELIQERIKKLRQYGEVTNTWANLLEVVLDNFILSFEQPTSNVVIKFWQHIVSWGENGSGQTDVSGWLTAFFFFDRYGKPEDIGDGKGFGQLTLDKVIFPVVNLSSSEVAEGFAEVEVKLNDNGKEIDCIMVAGIVGSRISSSKDRPLDLSPSASSWSLFGFGKSGNKGKENDTVSPVPGWWLLEKPAPELAGWGHRRG